ncbi:Myo-inositol-1-phosphate synthase [Marasmius sp. AFHP31]|nr:Myo-inositol-1-phosphate synthase [Marasmius sp. AFHP31]
MNRKPLPSIYYPNFLVTNQEVRTNIVIQSNLTSNTSGWIKKDGVRTRIVLPCSGLGTPNATTRLPSLNAIRTSHAEVSTLTLFAITLSRGSAVFLRKPSCQASLTSLSTHRRPQIQVESGQTTSELVSADSLVIAGGQTPLHRFLQPSGR